MSTISLEEEIEHFNPGPFPFNNKLIAPFWADVDTRAAGMVWYRLSNTTVDINFARDYIEVGFPTQPLFTPLSVFVATWEGVGYYDRRSNLVSERRTTELLIITCIIDTLVLGTLM